jgi:hypothetical protein
MTGKEGMDAGQFTEEQRLEMLERVTNALIELEWKDFKKECATEG